jgi:16S rRNA G966 N2-methylase RsmD
MMRRTKKYYGGILSRTTRKNIASDISRVTKTQAVESFRKLKQTGCKTQKPKSRIGNDFVDYFTHLERLHTVGNKGIDFFDFYEHRNIHKKQKYIQKMLDFYRKDRGLDDKDPRVWKYIFNMYFGAVHIFKPLNAVEIYCKFKPTSILDFTMGWGGRMIAAVALGIPRYTGIDLNTNLKSAYNDMVKTLKTAGEMENTVVDLRFQDALTVDYSQIDYDMVFTSPPYYNIELYRGTAEKTEAVWNREFYSPIFTKTMQHLKLGGHYCLNIPERVYKTVCIPLFGKSYRKIILKKSDRVDSPYKEYIYIWKKN